jgi:hypothetical protein
MPAIPPRVSTSSTKNSRIGPKAWPLSHGVCGHGMRSMVVRMAVMVVSVMKRARLVLPGMSVQCCEKFFRASTRALRVG